MSDELVDPKAFAFALGHIDDGFVFEEFCHQFVSQVLGHELVPAGGIKDRGIDALSHVFERQRFSRWIYQSSIEKDPQNKIEKTASALAKNQIEYDILHYVTNQLVDKKDRVIADYFEAHAKPLQIYDLAWLSANANHNSGTQNAFRVFASRYLHQYQLPGAGYVVSDLVADPRLYVFLRQQWERSPGEDLQAVLADTLILFALEDTDPDQGKLKRTDEILADIASRISFDPKALRDVIQVRLKALATKPRRINHHPQEDAYCLPYGTRCAIQDRNLADAALQSTFRQQSAEGLKRFLDGVRVQNAVGLLEEVLHRLFYQQGLEFSGFVLKGENREAIEKSLRKRPCQGHTSKLDFPRAVGRGRNWAGGTPPSESCGRLSL